MLQGNEYRRSGKNKAAEHEYNAALQLARTIGAESAQTTESMRAMADLYVSLGPSYYDKAAPLLQSERTILLQFGKDYPDLAHSELSLVTIAAYHDDFTQAARLLDHVIHLKELWGEHNRDSSIIDIELLRAELYLKQNRPDEAKLIIKEACVLLNKRKKKVAFEAVSKRALDDLLKCGGAFNQANQYMKAADAIRAALNLAGNVAIREQAAAVCYEQLATTLETAGRSTTGQEKQKLFDQAIVAHLEAINRFKKLKNFSDYYMTAAARSLHSIYADQQRLDECVKLTDDMARSAIQRSTSPLLSTVHAIDTAAVLKDRKDYKRANHYYQVAYAAIKNGYMPARRTVPWRRVFPHPSVQQLYDTAILNGLEDYAKLLELTDSKAKAMSVRAEMKLLRAEWSKS